MKTTFKTLLCTSLLLAFVSGCGKDQKTGSAAPAPAPLPLMNPIISPNMPSQGQQALDSIKAWYAASEQPTAGFRGTFIKKANSAQNGFKLDFSFCIGSWGVNCDSQQAAVTPTHCYVKSADQVNYDLGVPSAGAPFGCNLTQTAVTKATNVDLTKAVNGNGLTLLNIMAQNGVYHLTYGSFNQFGQSLPQAIYTINTNIHSIHNPVQIQVPGSTTTVIPLTIVNM